MATVYVTYGDVGVRGGNRDDVAVLIGNAALSEVITSGIASVPGTRIAKGRIFAIIHCETALWVTAGKAPVAAVPSGTPAITNSIYVPPTQGGYPISLEDGEMIAVIDG